MFPIQTFGTSAMYLSAVLLATMQTEACHGDMPDIKGDRNQFYLQFVTISVR